MRNVKIKLFITLLSLIVLINCNAQVKYSIVYRINPLENGETLDFKQVIIDDEPNYTTVIYKVNDRKREEIKRIKNVVCWPKLLSDSTKLIYMVYDQNDKFGDNFTYILDGHKGEVYFIGKISCAFDITTDGRYICYRIPQYVEKLSPEKIKQGYYPGVIPGLKWKDLKTGKTREYDFSNTFLKDKWNVGVDIRYIPEREVFSLNFYIEDDTYSRGFINIVGGDYQEYTDVIGRGYVNSKKAILRKSPTENGSIVMIGRNIPWKVVPGYRKVDILEKTKNKAKIGSNNDYWYKVRTFSMYEGWIYGAYITLEK